MVFSIFLVLFFVGITNPDFYNILKQYFILNTSHLTTNIFFSSYTHTDSSHLMENVSSYIILFLLVFSLVDNKKKIKQLMFLALIVFPFVNSLTLALITKIDAGGGLSGINACLNGYLFLAINYNLKKNSHLSLKKYTILILIISNLLIATGYILDNFYLITVAIIIILFLFYINRSIFWEAWTNLKNSKIDIENCLKCTMWVFAFVFVISPFRMLAPLFASDSNIEYIAHYLGFFYGLIFSWLILH